MTAISIVKRDGKRASEAFSYDKLHASIQAACLSVRTPEGEAATIAHRVCDELLAWLQEKPEVTSADLRRKASQSLTILHPEAAYFYKHYQLVM